MEYVEDGYDDCGDNSDEEFVCDDGDTILKLVNDGEDCTNGEDETYEQPDSVDIYVYELCESEMNFDYEVYGMEYDEDYEISWTVTDDEGTTSDAGSTAITDGSYRHTRVNMLKSTVLASTVLMLKSHELVTAQSLERIKNAIRFRKRLSQVTDL